MDIIQVINKLGSPRIMVIGDLILDKYIWGKVSRISPEAPIQILNAEQEEIRLGGAANVCHNLITLGAKVELLGVVGQDQAGRLLKRNLAALGVSLEGILPDARKLTPVKTRFIAQNQQVLRVDQENILPISLKIEKKLLSYIARRLKYCELVLVSDYGKGTLTDTLLKGLRGLCRAEKKKFIIDPKGRDYLKYRAATAIIPNRTEAEQATGMEIKDSQSYYQAAQKLLKKLNLEFVIITLGEKGIYLLSRDGQEIYDPAKPLKVYDVTGAGDTALAAIGLGLASGFDFATTIHLANLAAGVVVGKVGTATVTREELIEHFNTLNKPFKISEKIKSLKELLEVLNSQHQSRKIVFTNGCFDMLHPGHISTLEFARSQGDILIVGLNSDSSVRRLKGEARPIFKQDLRAKMLAALSAVDYVVIFDELTPLNLIRKIRPHILVKGADWRGKKIVGREVVESYGGKVKFAPLVPGISTTKILEKVGIER